ncbi:hypothetical protein L9G15_24715, partial [Shewanella sp. A3A]|nr:hypothetical protein [Shewanella ferrihydritica]
TGLQPVTCIGIDNIPRTFYIKTKRDEDSSNETWYFRAHLHDPPVLEEDFFELKIERETPDTFRITSISHFWKPWYMQKGIPGTYEA